MASHCGLDFGTSNSTLATAAWGEPRLLALEEGRTTIPSVIFFGFEDGAVHFGRKALAEYVSGADGRIMRSLKSILGTSLMRDTTRIRQRATPFSEILGLFIGALKARAEEETGEAIDSVVVGRPVHFVDDDRTADAEAERQLVAATRAQGFAHVETQLEPIAAAFDHERSLKSEELALVADLGGGTSDFTVIRLSPERARALDRQADVLSTSGVHIGGTDFDRLLSLRQIMPHLGQGTPTLDGKRLLPIGPYYDLSTWHRINRLYTRGAHTELRQTRREAAIPEPVDMLIAIVEERQGHNLLAAVETAKIALSDAETAKFRFDVRGRWIAEPLQRADFDEAIADAVERIAGALMQAVSAAGVAPDAIDSAILTGGSTQVPLVEAALNRTLPTARFVRTDAFGSVGLGLALDAARRFR
jgi:hypothetical chaperone protein